MTTKYHASHEFNWNVWTIEFTTYIILTQINNSWCIFWIHILDVFRRFILLRNLFYNPAWAVILIINSLRISFQTSSVEKLDYTLNLGWVRVEAKLFGSFQFHFFLLDKKNIKDFFVFNFIFVVVVAVVAVGTIINSLAHILTLFRYYWMYQRICLANFFLFA